MTLTDHHLFCIKITYTYGTYFQAYFADFKQLLCEKMGESVSVFELIIKDWW